MIRINGLSEGLELFKTLGSDTRMQIISLLSKNKEMNINELALAMDLTNGALTAHIRKLESAGIIQVENCHTGRGIQKICSLKEDQLLLNVYPNVEDQSAKVYETSIPIGHYTAYSVQNDCGLLEPTMPIGPENDPRCFAYPQRVNAQMLWFHDGFIEYRIPNLLPEKSRILQLTISMEISSADHGEYYDSLSDISFYLNNYSLGEWHSTPGPGNSHGIYTPLWWTTSLRQHGYLKMIVINGMGVFLDGVKIQSTGPDFPFLDSEGEMRFRIETHPSGERNGGVALYGDNFGNYSQNIQAIVHYTAEDRIQ